jgi:SNF2 family DNA or RNA helicase
MIRATIDSDVIRLSFRYNPDYIQRIKTLPKPFRRYDPETRTWTIPRPQWRNFLRIFRDVPIQIPDEQVEEFSYLENPWKIPSVPKVKGFQGELYGFQQKGVGFLISRKTCLLADELGLGKSVMSIAASLELRNRGLARRVLVLCPKSLIRQWITEYYRFTDRSAVAIMGNKAQRRLAYELCGSVEAFFAVTNYATVLREAEDLARLNPDITILDEVTRIKNYRAKTTRMIKRYFRTPYRWALSGTPMENRLAELHSIMEWINPGIFGPWWIFSDRYIIIKERYIRVRGGQRRRFKEIVGHRNLAELRDQIKGWMLRRRKRDVLPDLPPVTTNNYYVELSRDERRAYSLIRRRVGELYERHWRSNAVLAELTFLRECCDHPLLVADELEALGFDGRLEESSKLNELLEILEDFSGHKVVIYSEWVSMLGLIADAVQEDYWTEMLHGGLSPDQREAVVHTFTTNRDCQILLSSDVGQQGLNLQAADVVINYSLHWNPARLQQRIGRLHRIGQKNTVTCINLTTVGTVEERVFNVLRKKTSLFHKIVEGDFSGIDESIIWRILEEEIREGRRKNWGF